jgi:hypothetical protein
LGRGWAPLLAVTIEMLPQRISLGSVVGTQASAKRGFLILTPNGFLIKCNKGTYYTGHIQYSSGRCGSISSTWDALSFATAVADHRLIPAPTKSLIYLLIN